MNQTEGHNVEPKKALAEKRLTNKLQSAFDFKNLQLNKCVKSMQFYVSLKHWITSQNDSIK